MNVIEEAPCHIGSSSLSDEIVLITGGSRDIGRSYALRLAADVTDMASAQDIVARIDGEKGPIDVLINNAGTLGPICNAWECEWDAWWRTIEDSVKDLRMLRPRL
ncbi:enoyl-ACP reductase-like protein [Luteibacter sp. OK325]|uniref:SDR family NAD(P)-dependent oxidoreductase n=1 Tax=Luteibacter sp. OK325 TaxID=2135670 RepID=UPI000D3523BE|nr:SDR family oxidoreductase [Luteibacter sp. OK325]PTR34525.1 enoyl-ACP reductase-like protein [Luteibacter sp. OK325]